MTPFWIEVDEAELRQGDLLPKCNVPIFGSEYGPHQVVPVAIADLVVLTQSCDLMKEKIEMVALCPIAVLNEFEEVNPRFRKKGEWESVRKGRWEGLHLLASPTEPEVNRKALVVDFQHVISLPFAYLTAHAGQLGKRWRLDSPFLEHFSQAFARFFMRVGLPSELPKFT